MFSTYFRESEEGYSLTRAYLGILVSLAMLILGILQTQWFVSFLPRPDTETIRQHIAASRELQNQIRTSYQEGKEPLRGMGFNHELFGEQESTALMRAWDSLVSDARLQKELEQAFGSSFRDINVQLVPAREINPATHNNASLGLTPYGWHEATTAWKFGDSGITIRDRPSNQHVTIDGTPIIVLAPWAFKSDKTLRLALFHQVLHAMNVPGYNPSILNFVQDDLIYLPEYRDFINRERLGRFQEISIWLLAVIMPLLICVRCVYTVITTNRNTLTKQLQR